MPNTPKQSPAQAGTDCKAPSSPAGRKLAGASAHHTSPPATGPQPTQGSLVKKRGAPPGNRNARGNIRHGLKAGSLPKDARYIEVRLNQFRRNLEDAVIAAKGEVSLADAAAIQTACRWERHACLAQRWLTKQYAELKPLDRLTFSREISRASGERDKAIRLLGLDVRPKNDWSAILVPAEADHDQAD